MPQREGVSVTVVGHRVRPVDWIAKTAGTAIYAGDAAPQDCLHAKVLRSSVPHASIIRLDTSRARALPGVRAVITSFDFGDVVYEHSAEGFSDRPPLARDKVLYVGQEIAAVAADTLQIAEEAIRLIDVRYKRLPALLSAEAALANGAPRLHERPSGSNIALEVDGTWGDRSAAEKQAVKSVTGAYRYHRVAHECMETNTAVASWHDDRLELWVSSQAPHFVVHELARVLNLELDQVVCRDVSVGGGFGSKSKVSEHEAIAGLLSIRAGAPVNLTYTREEETSVVKPRHEFWTNLRASADSEGRICFLDASVDVDNGAYNHYGPSVMRAGIKQLGSMYRPDAVSWRGRLVDTNLPPGGQFRGYGTPQTALALESIIDRLAEACGIDPLEFRIDNASKPDSTALAGARVGSNRLIDCLHHVRDYLDWHTKKASKAFGRGVGVAAGMHASGSYAYPGGNLSAAGIEVTAGGDVIVRFGGADAGTGQRTILAQIAAEILTVPLSDVSVIMADWDETPPEMGAWSSRGTHMGGHATKQAAEAIRDTLREAAVENLGTDQVRLKHGAFESNNGSVRIADLAGMCADSKDGGLRVDKEFVEERMEPYWTGIPTPNISPSYTYAAHGVEVEIDTDTGELTILDYVAAHDVGRAINPGMVEGQIIGGVVQGLGPVFGEELIYEGGRVANDGYLNYPVPRSTAVPHITAVLVEGDELAGPFDAKSVGEMPIVPPAPAVLNAVYDAIGIRFERLPLTPDVILSALREQHEEPSPRPPATRRSFHLWRRPKRWQIALFRQLYPRGIHYLLERWGKYWIRRKSPRDVNKIVDATSTSEVTTELAESASACVCGGGTDLHVQRKQLLANPTTLVLVKSNPQMNSITDTQDYSRIGAAVTLTELADWAGTRLRGLTEVVGTIASEQIRNVATVGGNLAQEKRCWFYRSGFNCYKRAGVTSPCFAVMGDHRFYHAAIDGHRCQAVTPSDLASAFMAMDASVEITGAESTRIIKIVDLYDGPGELTLADAEFIAAVLVPKDALTRRFAFEKIQLSQGDFALVSLAASAHITPDGVWRQPRFVFGSMAPVPWRARQFEAALDGTAPSAERISTQLTHELSRAAHPLPGNAWKIDAAIGLVSRIARKWIDYE